MIAFLVADVVFIMCCMRVSSKCSRLEEEEYLNKIINKKDL